MGDLRELLAKVEAAPVFAGTSDALVSLDYLGMQICVALDAIPERGDPGYPNPPTTSVDAALALIEKRLPGWWATCGLCALTGHASIGPDYNGPHRERLSREFPVETFGNGFDADLAPGDGLHRVALALMACLLDAEIARSPAPDPAGSERTGRRSAAMGRRGYDR